MPPSKLERICSVLTRVSPGSSFAQLQDRLFRAGQNLFGLFLPDNAAVDQFLRGKTIRRSVDLSLTIFT